MKEVVDQREMSHSNRRENKYHDKRIRDRYTYILKALMNYIVIYNSQTKYPLERERENINIKKAKRTIL